MPHPYLDCNDPADLLGGLDQVGVGKMGVGKMGVARRCPVSSVPEQLAH